MGWYVNVENWPLRGANSFDEPPKSWPNAFKLTIHYISVEGPCSALISGLRVWPEFGGGGPPKQLTPRSGQSSAFILNITAASENEFQCHQFLSVKNTLVSNFKIESVDTAGPQIKNGLFAGQTRQAESDWAGLAR